MDERSFEFNPPPGALIRSVRPQAFPLQWVGLVPIYDERDSDVARSRFFRPTIAITIPGG